jgi:glycosyltransferase involved in cell wall biosynthesis
MSHIKLAIVVPCYNEEKVLRETTARLSEVIEHLVERGDISADSFMLYVSDGSSDNTWNLIAELHHAAPHRVL